MDGAANGFAGAARWSLRVFGGFELGVLPACERVGMSSKRDRVLLAYLALSPKCRWPRRKLATLLWGDAGDETALDNLRVCIWSVRKALEDAGHRIIASDGEDIVLDISAFDVDALAFRRLAGGSEPADLEAAADLYAGEFLDGLEIGSEEFESWRRLEAVRFRDEAIDVLIRLMTQLGNLGEIERAIQTGHRILKLEPLHESAVRRLMRLYAQSGRRGAAIELYRKFADALRGELNVQPQAETRAAFAELAGGVAEQEGAPAGASTEAAAQIEQTEPVPILLSAPPSREHFAAPESSARRQKTRFFGWMLGGALAAATASLLFFEFGMPVSTLTGRPGVEAAASSVPAGTISVAVLPFTNLSSDASQEFFSDGITEEITSALARIPNLHVVARTSAFEFKGQNRNIQAIAQTLHATHLIEGSVRKNGERVRITAQLIEAQSGLQVWTNSYDRQLLNIFAIQEEIAQAIAVALRVPLGLAPGQALVSNRMIEPESYQQFLRAKALVHQRRGPNQETGIVGLTEAIKLLERVVARDPNFAPAWAQLALAYQRIPTFTPGFQYASAADKRHAADEWLPKATVAAERAIASDANLADGYSSLGGVNAARGQRLRAEELYSKALALDPYSPEALQSYANHLGAVGRTEEALKMKQQLLSMEPFVNAYNGGVRDLLWTSGQTDKLIAMLNATKSPIDLSYFAQLYAVQGRFSEAADALKAIPPGTYPEGMVEDAVRLLRTAPAAPVSPAKLPRLGDRLDFVYIFVGAPERVLERFEADLAAGLSAGQIITRIWSPIYAPVRKTERFKAFARDAGLVEYWRAKGWPEFCRPVGADDFTCN